VGIVKGRAIEAEVTRKEIVPRASQTLLGDIDRGIKVLLYVVDETAMELRAMEGAPGGDVSHYSLKRKVHSG
jgi:hypothetical protein